LLVTLVSVGGLRAIDAQARPPVPEEDTQVWNDMQIAVALSKRVDFNLFGTFRFGRDVTHLVDRRAGVGFSFRPGRYLTLASWYLNVATRPAEGRKGNENRLHFAATLRFPVGKFSLSDRNLVERRLRFPLNSTRYRNRLQLDYPVRLGGTRLELFTSDEIFYDWSVDEFVRNRFTAGISRRFNNHFTGDLYYLRQNDSRSRPGDLHVIGLAYRIRL
jgi:hypothetical protein